MAYEYAKSKQQRLEADAGQRGLCGRCVGSGCRFMAGYPITPATEIPEYLSDKMFAAGGVFMQMEDELASINAVIGASWGGARAMTATSGRASP